MTRREFESLLDYSHSLPTGTTYGKRWRRNNTPRVTINDVMMLHPFGTFPDGGIRYKDALIDEPPVEWLQGQYLPLPLVGEPEKIPVLIVWTRIEIVEPS